MASSCRSEAATTSMVFLMFPAPAGGSEVENVPVVCATVILEPVLRETVMWLTAPGLSMMGVSGGEMHPDG